MGLMAYGLGLLKVRSVSGLFQRASSAFSYLHENDGHASLLAKTASADVCC